MLENNPEVLNYPGLISLKNGAWPSQNVYTPVGTRTPSFCPVTASPHKLFSVTPWLLSHRPQAKVYSREERGCPAMSEPASVLELEPQLCRQFFSTFPACKELSAIRNAQDNWIMKWRKRKTWLLGRPHQPSPTVALLSGCHCSLIMSLLTEVLCVIYIFAVPSVSDILFYIICIHKFIMRNFSVLKE